MIQLDFRDMHLDGDRPRDAFGILLGVNATFTVLAGELQLLVEEEFPIVELAAQLKHWVDCGGDAPFEYESLEAEDILLWFKPESAGWLIGSDWQNEPSEHLFRLDDFKSAAGSYIDRVKRQVKAELDLDVTKAFNLR